MQSKELLAFQTSLLKELIANNELGGLVEKLSYSVGYPVVVTNSSYRIIITAGLKQRILSNYLQVFPSKSANYHMLKISEEETDQGFVFPIKSKHENLGFLVFLCDQTEHEKIIKYAAIATDICAISLLKQAQINLAERQLKDPFVFDLLYGNMNSDEDIINRGKLWGWELEKPHCVVVFELNEYEQYTSDKQIALDLLDIVESELAKMEQAPIVFRKRGEVTAILGLDIKRAQERKAYINILVRKVLALAEELYPDRVISVGSGRTYLKPSDIFRSYQEAKVALELGRIMNIRSKTPFFRDLGLARILYNHDQQELAEFYKDNIGELIRYDQEQNTEFVQTLESFFLNRCDLKAAADDLFLHPNTLRYRLKKIEEILEINLNDIDTKLDLMTTFKIKHIKKV